MTLERNKQKEETKDTREVRPLNMPSPSEVILFLSNVMRTVIALCGIIHWENTNKDNKFFKMAKVPEETEEMLFSARSLRNENE